MNRPFFTKANLLKTSCVGVFVVMAVSCATPSVPPKPVFEPDITAHNEFSNAMQEGLEVVPDWWTNFDDSTLVFLVEKALRENRDIDVAQANLNEADALLKSARLGRSYSTSSSAGADLGRTIGPNRDVELSLSGGLAGSWEYDAFGGIAAQISAAEFNRETVLQAKRDVAVLIASQTAQAYVDLRGAQQRLNVAQRNADAQAEALGLIQNLADNGRSSDLDLNRAETLYRTTLASLPLFLAAKQTAAAQLAALTGTSANDVYETFPELGLAGRFPEHKTALVTGSPQDLISRRADIRQAEADISRRLALSDVERARLFPTIVFNADIGALFNGTNRLDQLSSFGFGIGPAISWEGPDLRSVRADIDVSDAQTEAAIAQYEQTVFSALSDVEIALARYGRELERRDNLGKASASARKALMLARLRFDEGYDDYLDVLDAQRTLLDAEDDLVQNNILITTYAISAYRALGGMWTEDELSSGQIQSSELTAN